MTSTTRNPWWKRLAALVGVEIYRNGELAPSYDAELAAAGRYVFVHNDSVSRIDLVAKWLRQSFDLETRTAERTAGVIHLHGFAAMGPFSTEETEHRLERARTIASELGLSSLQFSREPPRSHDPRA